METMKRSRKQLEELRQEKEKLEPTLIGLFIPILHEKQVNPSFSS
jgi:hypothetical protein